MKIIFIYYMTWNTCVQLIKLPFSSILIWNRFSFALFGAFLNKINTLLPVDSMLSGILSPQNLSPKEFAKTFGPSNIWREESSHPSDRSKLNWMNLRWTVISDGAVIFHEQTSLFNKLIGELSIIVLSSYVPAQFVETDTEMNEEFNLTKLTMLIKMFKMINANNVIKVSSIYCMVGNLSFCCIWVCDPLCHKWIACNTFLQDTHLEKSHGNLAPKTHLTASQER